MLPPHAPAHLRRAHPPLSVRATFSSAHGALLQRAGPSVSSPHQGGDETDIHRFAFVHCEVATLAEHHLPSQVLTRLNTAAVKAEFEAKRSLHGGDLNNEFGGEMLKDKEAFHFGTLIHIFSCIIEFAYWNRLQKEEPKGKCRSSAFTLLQLSEEQSSNQSDWLVLISNDGNGEKGKRRKSNGQCL
ncbi:hypothetical protein JEQ12_009307 [Ovis aries]|uniref:Uncharacterized protein n=1 Tax=Ovis aries TaxID=9940 RepID=A0A836AAU5_SHEEP|nr:hypothetical protein JEQ12_009307 [Ovis aries]